MVVDLKKEMGGVAVIGAGICGICTALALAKKGNKVTIYERDVPPPPGGGDEAFFEWRRKGAAQFRHPHAFLGLMCNILQDNYPELVEDFWAAGARKISFEDMLSPELRDNYSPEPIDEKLWLLMCRRATMETVLRRYAQRQDNIVINSTSNVTGIKAGTKDGVINIEALMLDCQGEKSEVEVNVVVDACGRTSSFSAWFKELGAEIEIEDDESEIVYYTRHYKLLPGVEEPPRDGKDRSAGDLGYIKYGVFPGESGHFAVIICLPNGEKELREAVKSGDQFNRICRSIPGLTPWLAEDRSVSTTQPFGFGDIHAVWRHFVKDGKPVALNYFAVGDAAIRTNPLYGRGCSIGILHAHLLADVLTEVADPLERAIRFDQVTEEEIRPIFKASLSEDKSGIKRAAAIQAGDLLDRADSPKKWLGLAFGDAVAAAARDEIHVIRGAMKTFNLLEKPGDFLKDWAIRLTIFRYLFRGRLKNAQARMQRGPSRIEMVDLVEGNLPIVGSSS
jgi:2-polyprenyl-6-methoxyphenol hydroxylase-like FAD-dependent oxidoreductase